MAVSTQDDIDRIRKRIKELGMKNKAVAEKAGIHEVYFSYILNGTRPLTAEVMDKVFSVLGMD